jgi:hypothetical protein
MSDVYAPPQPPPPQPPSSSGYDVLRPFVFLFDDPRWMPKVMLGGLFVLLSTVVAGIPFLLGYIARMMRNIIAGDPRPLPEWDDLGEFFGEGLVLFGVSLIYMLPVSVLSILVAIPAAFVDNVTQPGLHEVGAGIVTCASCVVSMLSFVITLILPAAMLRVIATRRFGAAFELREVWVFITRNIGNYLLPLVTELVAYILSFAGLALLCVGVIFTFFWAVLVAGYAFATVWRAAPQS